MGSNCSCLRGKSIETDIAICDENQIEFFLSSVKAKNPKCIKYVIKIQSHIRGLLARTRINGKNFYIGKFLPYIEQDTPYTPAEISLINDDEIKTLFDTYPQLSDNIPVVFLKPIEYSNGCQYCGEFNQNNNQKHGRGIWKWQDGPVYIGQFRWDKAHGKGKILFRDNEEYQGEWEDNKATGFGVYISKEVKYEGKWKNDRQDGIGTELWSDGTSYTGEFKQGQKTGKGKFKNIDGSTYTGTFYNNQFHGKGISVWSDKREYNGEWKYNKIEGEGVFKWPDGRKYIGHYKNDKKDGYGIFEWPDGKKYKGYWKNGKQQGDGEWYNPVEKIWEKGKWKDGKKEKMNSSALNTTKDEKGEKVEISGSNYSSLSEQKKIKV